MNGVSELVRMYIKMGRESNGISWVINDLQFII